MIAKLLGGLLLGVFVTAVGVELVKRKCPGFTKKVSDGTRKALETTSATIKNFTTTAKTSFREGYASVKAETCAA